MTDFGIKHSIPITLISHDVSAFCLFFRHRMNFSAFFVVFIIHIFTAVKAYKRY